mgnify:CR=1 FL=1
MYCESKVSAHYFTIFPRSSDPFYIVTHIHRWVTTSWTYSTKAVQNICTYFWVTQFMYCRHEMLFCQFLLHNTFYDMSKNSCLFFITIVTKSRQDILDIQYTYRKSACEQWTSCETTRWREIWSSVAPPRTSESWRANTVWWVHNCGIISLLSTMSLVLYLNICLFQT